MDRILRDEAEVVDRELVMRLGIRDDGGDGDLAAGSRCCRYGYE